MKTKKMTWLALLALILTLAFPSAALSGKAAGTIYRVTVSSGYLALRSDTVYDASNEIGKLYAGDTVELCDMTTSAYWFVYSSKLDKYGYVNKDYLTEVSQAATWLCAVQKHLTPPMKLESFTAVTPCRCRIRVIPPTGTCTHQNSERTAM